MKKIFPMLLCLTGCVSTDPTPQQMTTNADRCASIYRQGTPGYADCQMSLMLMTAQKNEIARRDLHNFFVGLQ